MALARRFKVAHDEVFPFGGVPRLRRHPGLRLREVDAEDQGPGRRRGERAAGLVDRRPRRGPEGPKKSKTVTVKISAKVQPVPSNDGSSPFTGVRFEGLTATPWVDSPRCGAPEPGKSHRCRAQSAWSFRAESMSPAKSTGGASSPATKAA